jgi:Tol biopolymer transport system component
MCSAEWVDNRYLEGGRIMEERRFSDWHLKPTALALTVLLLLGLSVIACDLSSFGMGEPQVEAVTVCQYLDNDYEPVNPTSSFDVDEQPCVSVKVSNLKDGSSVKARWLLDGKPVDEVSYLSETSGSGYVGFRFTPDGPMQPGDYVVEIQLDGKPVGVGSFTVTGAVAAEPSPPSEPPPASPAPPKEPTAESTKAAPKPEETVAAPPSPDATSGGASFPIDFESELTWRIGDEPHGSFSHSKDQSKAGSYSGKLSYQFPAVDNNYVVFEVSPHIPLPDDTEGIVASVYGDGSGHYLNVWMADAAGEIRQYAFGKVDHQGWREMTASFDDDAGWPNTHISGADNGVLDHPISFYGFVLDGVPDGKASDGTIYIDEARTTGETQVESTVEKEAEPSPTTQTSAALTGRIIFPVYVSGRINKPYDVYMSNLDGSNRQKIIAEAGQPAFMLPDGQMVAVFSRADMNLGVRLYTVSNGQLSGSVTDLEDGHPSWSPDGTRIVFDSIHWNPSQGRQIRIIDAGSRDINSATPPGGGMAVYGEFPSWLADGRIVYRQINDPSGKGGLWVINEDGTGKKQLSEGSNDGSASGSPDGSQVAYMSMQGGDWDVCVVSSYGGAFQNLTEGTPGNDGLPAWSPDGQHIAFVTDRSGVWEVWAMRPDGSDQRKLFVLESGFSTGYDGPTAYYNDWASQRLSWAR